MIIDNQLNDNEKADTMPLYKYAVHQQAKPE
jgi:hypothetical protein